MLINFKKKRIQYFEADDRLNLHGNRFFEHYILNSKLVMKSVKHYFCPVPFNKMKMKNLSALIALFAVLVLTGCGKLGKSSKGLPNDGQLHGVAPASKYNLTKPPGMVYIPPGTFHMGPSDEDVNYAFTARNKQISINGFWMDATEITNNEYRQFVNWVRDSTAATLMQYGKEVDGKFQIDWKKTQTIKWGDKATVEKIDEPMTKRYFSHPAFGNYPVVGVNWNQATVFCEWRTNYLNAYLDKSKMANE